MALLPLPATIMDRLRIPPSLSLLSSSHDSRCWVVSDPGERELVRVAVYDSSEPSATHFELPCPGVLSQEGASVLTEHYTQFGIPHLRHVVSPIFTEKGAYKVVIEPETDTLSTTKTYKQSWHPFYKIS